MSLSSRSAAGVFCLTFLISRHGRKQSSSTAIPSSVLPSTTVHTAMLGVPCTSRQPSDRLSTPISTHTMPHARLTARKVVSAHRNTTTFGFISSPDLFKSLALQTEQTSGTIENRNRNRIAKTKSEQKGEQNRQNQ